MKYVIFTISLAIGLSACADNRSSVNDNANSWERIRYHSQDNHR